MKTVFARLSPMISAHFINVQDVPAATDYSVVGSEYLAAMQAECKRIANLLLEDAKHASVKEIMETPQGQTYVGWLEKFLGDEFPVEEAIISSEPLISQPEKEKKQSASVVALISTQNNVEEDLTAEQKARREKLPPIVELRAIAESLGIETSQFGKARRALLTAIEEAERKLQKASVQQAEEQEKHNLAISNLEDICVIPVENVVVKAPAKPVVLPVKLDPEEVVKKVSSKTDDFDLDDFISKEDLNVENTNTDDEGDDEENKASDDDDDDDSLF